MKAKTIKSIPDDTVYRTASGLRVRIVKAKEHPGQPDWLKALPDPFTVAEISDGKRWYGYERKDLLTEEEWRARNRR